MQTPDRTALERRANHIRAGFVAQGTTMAAWCRENGVQAPNARKALLGSWKGPKADALVAKLIEASKIDGAS